MVAFEEKGSIRHLLANKWPGALPEETGKEPSQSAASRSEMGLSQVIGLRRVPLSNVESLGFILWETDQDPLRRGLRRDRMVKHEPTCAILTTLAALHYRHTVNFAKS